MDTAEPPQEKAALHNLFAQVVRSGLSLSSSSNSRSSWPCCTSNAVTLVHHSLHDSSVTGLFPTPPRFISHHWTCYTSKFSHCFKCSKVLLLPCFRTTAVQGKALFKANPQVILFPGSSEQFMHGCQHLWFGEDYRIMWGGCVPMPTFSTAQGLTGQVEPTDLWM